MDNENLKNYLRDTFLILIENAFKVNKDLQNAKGADADFLKGEIMGYVRVISLFEQQAKAFGLNPKDLGINIDPEKDLLT